MRTAGIYKFLTAIVTIGAAVLWMPEVGSTGQGEWQKLPKLVLQECVAAERSVKHNPLSKFRNDFFVITTYEEYGDTGSITKKEYETLGRAKALNAYLVLGVFVAPDKPVMLVHHMALIVAERNNDASPNADPTRLRRWILLDDDGDGRLDKAMFSESESTNETEDQAAGSQEAEIPSNQVASLQGYFEDAVRSLSKKAADGPANTCSRL